MKHVRGFVSRTLMTACMHATSSIGRIWQKIIRQMRDGRTDGRTDRQTYVYLFKHLKYRSSLLHLVCQCVLSVSCLLPKIHPITADRDSLTKGTVVSWQCTDDVSLAQSIAVGKFFSKSLPIFSCNHWSQATLSSVSTWMGDSRSSVAWVLLLNLKVG